MAVRKVSDLLDRVRQVLQDQDQDNYRYPTVDLVGYLNDAVLEARRIRPDMFVGRYLDDLPQVTTVASTDWSTIPMPLPDQWFVATYNYVAGRAEFRDDEFAVDNRAMTLMSQFTAMLTGGL
jgi:hypothetical protein